MTMLPNCLYRFLFALCAFSIQAQDFSIGACCPLSGCCANVFTNASQTILPGCAVVLEKINVQTEDFDCWLTDLNGFVCFAKPGFYKIRWNVEGLSEHSWSFGLFLDNAIVPGSVQGNFRAEPFSQKIGGSVILFIEEGQILSLINTSSNIVKLIQADRNSNEYLCPASLSISSVNR